MAKPLSPRAERMVEIARQAIKAGMLEIADIHVVSKCDRSDANRTHADLKHMLSLATKTTGSSAWQVPVIGVSAYQGMGLDALVAAITKHREATVDTEVGRARRRSIAEFRLQKTAEDLLLARFLELVAPLRAAMTERLERGEGNPYSLAQELVARVLTQGVRQ